MGCSESRCCEGSDATRRRASMTSMQNPDGSYDGDIESRSQSQSQSHSYSGSSSKSGSGSSRSTARRSRSSITRLIVVPPGTAPGASSATAPATDGSARLAELPSFAGRPANQSPTANSPETNPLDAPSRHRGARGLSPATSRESEGSPNAPALVLDSFREPGIGRRVGFSGRELDLEPAGQGATERDSDSNQQHFSPTNSDRPRYFSVGSVVVALERQELADESRAASISVLDNATEILRSGDRSRSDPSSSEKERRRPSDVASANSNCLTTFSTVTAGSEELREIEALEAEREQSPSVVAHEPQEALWWNDLIERQKTDSARLREKLERIREEYRAKQRPPPPIDPALRDAIAAWNVTVHPRQSSGARSSDDS